ncbi:hypothetical protein NECID01_0171 [Nematocida sp. AWRm77]|nr:hypothetical protein NECID01_0171 [Nematocida sp. AWRm77]
MKRVRSKKIEHDRKLGVFYEREIDPEKLQEYSGLAFTTGVEKEEEEEHHLKAVISGREENIPIPKIQKRTEVRAPSLLAQECAEELGGYLKDTGDVPNTHAEESASFSSQIVLQETEVSSVWQPYVCFRKREVKSLRKARKPDLSIEKIKKIKVDLQMLRRLAELTIQRDMYLAQHLSSIFSIFSICREMNKRLDIGVLNISESILRDILFTKLISKNDVFYKKIPSFTNLYTCRKSIGSLRKLFKNGPSQEEALSFSKKELEYLNTYIQE